MIISEKYVINPKRFYPEKKNFLKSQNFYNLFNKNLNLKSNIFYYKVQKGDTLTKILQKKLKELNVSVDRNEFNQMIYKIARDNNLKNPNLIFAGQILKIDISPKKVLNQQVSLPVNGLISSKFGLRLDPISKNIKFHNGVDIAAPIGTPIKSTISGEVIFSGRLRGYGNIVIIKNGNVVTKYAHNSVNLVKKGDFIHKGDIIAKVGSTGRSTGPHVHYEIVINNKHINPLTVDDLMLNNYIAIK